MNFSKKILYSVLMFMGLFTNLAQASEVRDVQGRTELINFVITTEARLGFIKSHIDRLWHACYENIHNTSGELQRRTTCTHTDIYALDIYEQELQKCTNDAVIGIATLVHAGADLQAQDCYGKTVLNYVYTKEIYNVLRAHGAHYQVRADVYFNGLNYAVGAFVCMVLVSTACQLYKEYTMDPIVKAARDKDLMDAFLVKSKGLSPETIKELNNEWYGTSSLRSTK